jgi:hypothetical protein
MLVKKKEERYLDVDPEKTSGSYVLVFSYVCMHGIIQKEEIIYVLLWYGSFILLFNLFFAFKVSWSPSRQAYFSSKTGTSSSHYATTSRMER